MVLKCINCIVLRDTRPKHLGGSSLMALILTVVKFGSRYSGPVLNLGGCQHFGRFVDLCPPQRVLQPLIYFLQAQRPGPLAEVHQHCGAQQVRQQGKRLVDSCRVGARTHSSLQTVPRRSAWARATSPAHPAPPVTGGEGPHSAL